VFLMIPTINRDDFLEHHYQVDLCNGGRVFSVFVNLLFSNIYTNSMSEGQYIVL
jgi:hypothetical protein